MKNPVLTITILILSYQLTNTQNIISSNSFYSQNSDSQRVSFNKKMQEHELQNRWSLNLIFSDNGYGFGGTYFIQMNKDLSAFGSIFFSSAKDDREFEYTDIYGNTYVPGKINRLFMVPVNFGLQYRMFREDVTDNLRPFINGGITPTSIIYTPYSVSFIPSFGYARAKYTLGTFAGVGMDYVMNKSSAASINVRYYYIYLFGHGIESLQDKPKNFFGGLYFVFSFNFLK